MPKEKKEYYNKAKLKYLPYFKTYMAVGEICSALTYALEASENMFN